MILLVASAHSRAGSNPRLGDFVTPRSYNLTGKTPIWAADNDAFGNFNRDRFLRMLDAIAKAATPPKFVTVPDVVCNHNATMDRWMEWSPEFRSRGIPRALVLQNGIERFPPEYGPPWNCVDALFIGGDNAFKFSGWVRHAVSLANYAGIWVHMGRVNSVKRLDYARRIGCDSVDGSGMSRFSRAVLTPMLRSLNHQQLYLL